MINIKKLSKECLGCPTKPCQKTCPLKNDIPSFIKKAKEKNFLEAFNILSETTVLPSICARVCPYDKKCEFNCVKKNKGKSVSISEIEAFIGDKATQNNYPLFANVENEKNKKIAIVGGGPAGLTCAAFLRKKGYKVTIYEKYNYLGGNINHGIPDFRLDKSILDKTIQKILDLGIEVKYNCEFGKDINLSNLKKEYDAVFLSFGSNISKKMNIKGKNLANVFGANDFLESKKVLDLKGKNVIVIGGGDVAMDMARTSKRWGGNVLVVYHREEKYMKALKNDVIKAKDEKIDFIFNANVYQIIANGNLSNVYIKTNEGLKFILPCDFVFFAIGSKPDEKTLKKLGIKLDINGYIKTDKNLMTSIPSVFAGGDIINEVNTVAYASQSGKMAANNIDLYLKKIDK